MYKKLFLIVSLVAALAVGSFAQSAKSQETSGPNVSTRLDDVESGLARFLDSDDDDAPRAASRPRLAESKITGVKSSVVSKIASAERSAFAILNQKRAENGLKPLVWSEALGSIARGHSQNMAEFKYFDHRGLDGKMVSDRADDAGLGGWRAIGENIAFNRGFDDPVAKAVDLWLNSPSHKNNLMSDKWKESAVGVAIAADGSYYFTQVFLARK